MSIRTTQAFRLVLAAVLAAALAACATDARPEPAPAQASASTAAPAPAATLAPARPSLPLPVLVSVDTQPDGTRRVRDLSNLYEFTLAEDWVAIPVTPEQIQKLGQASPAPDAEFLGLARKLGEQQTDAFRVVGTRSASAAAPGSGPALLLVTAIPDAVSSMLPMPELARMIQDTVFAGMGEAQQDVVQNAKGMSIAVVEGPYEYLSTQGETLPSRSKVFGFQANSRVILIQFIASADAAPAVLPAADKVVDTIQRIKP